MLVLPLAAAFLILAATPALAAKTHALKNTFGSFSSPSGIAIDKSNGNIFVADGGSNNSVEIFGPGGGAPSEVIVTKMEGFAFEGEPSGLAIDNSATSPSKGALYVTDVTAAASGGGKGTVEKFTLNPESQEYELKEKLSASPVFFEPLGVAVDAKGNVFVSDWGGEAIFEFDPTGVQIRRIDVKQSVNKPSALAFDSAGNLYVQSLFGNVFRFTANLSGEIEPGTVPVRIVENTATGIAVDQSTDSLYVGEQNQISQYSTSCTPSGGQCTPELTFGFGTLDSTQRIAVAPTGDIYVADRGKGDVAVFDSALSLIPESTTEAATQVKQTSATLNATVSAAGGPPASCQFEYIAKESFLSSESFEGATSVPCSPAGPYTGTSKEAVKADIGGLDPGKAYLFRLLAFNENGPDFGHALSFATVGMPKIDASFISLITRDSVSVGGLVNPNGGPNAAQATTYVVEYVSDKDFKESEWANASSVPLGGQAIGSGTDDVEVTQQLKGILAFTTYHFRIVAENEAGIAQGPDKTFTTYLEQGAGLPDGRAYEQVTPVDKNGANPQGENNYVRAASGGGGITFFSNSGIPGSEGSQQFPQYIASRAANGSGWTSQGALPPASNGSSALVRGYSEDLSQAYVTQSKLPSEHGTFYQRDNTTHALRVVGSGLGVTNIHNAYAGESTDTTKVLIELTYGPGAPLGAAEGQNTFVWDKSTGALSLAGALNDEQAPAGGTSAGSYDVGGPANYTLYEHAISRDGSHVFFTTIASRQVYLRLNPTKPQSELDSEGNCTEAALACTVQVSGSQRSIPDPKGPKPATLWSATPDGSQAFFTSSAKLTNNATTGPKSEGNDLYRYEVESGELTDLTHDAVDPNGAEVQGVLGASEDGSYVYFVANGVLAPGATVGNCKNKADENYIEFTVGDCNLYLWHEGDITFIAGLHASGGNDITNDALNWVRKPGVANAKKTARVSADGRTLLFGSQKELTSFDNNGFAELYRYAADDDELSCVSCSPTGIAPIASASLQNIGVAISSNVAPAAVQTRSLSADGSRVFFQTPDKLVASDTNGDDGCPVQSVTGTAEKIPSCQDIYEWEARGTGSCESEAQNDGCLYLISTGVSSEPSFFGDASLDGNDAFIFTLQWLVGQDKDQLVDIYDARVGGGIASQNPPPPPVPCEAEGCKPGSAVPPISESPATSSFSGPANQKSSRHRKKQRHHKKKHHRKRHATGKRG